MKAWLSRLGSAALSLILAVMVWTVAVREEYPQRDFEQPITVTRSGLPEDLTIFGDILNEVRIEVRAPKARWENLRARDFTAWVDLADLGAGEFDVRVQVLAPDPQVQVTAVDPPMIRVRLEAREQKSVPVRANIMDAPASGYTWQTPVITPTQVLVSGSAPLVDQVSTVAVDVYLRDARSSVERTLRVAARDSTGETVGFVDVTPRDVAVHVPVTQVPGYREIAILVEPVGTPETGYTVSAVTADPKLVTVQGSPLVIAELSGYITVPVDITGANQDVIERVPLKLPESVSALGVQSANVRISIVPITGVQTVRRKPTIQGLGPGLSYTLTLDSVSVFLSGPLPKLLALNEDAVPVMLDLSGMGPGVYVLEPAVPVPSDIRVEGIAPQTVEVTIGPAPTPTVTPAAAPEGAPETAPPRATRSP